MSQATSEQSLAAITDRAAEWFAEQFGRRAVFAAAAPGRVNLIGDHTDDHGGLVLPIALDRWTVLTGGENGSQRCRLFAGDLEEERDQLAAFLNDDSIAPGRRGWANYIKGVIAQFRANGHELPSFDAAIASSVPMGAGLSSSAALSVAAATLIELLLGIRLDPVRKARWSQVAERQFTGAPCGIMDHLVACCARQGCAVLMDCGRLETRLVPIDTSEVALLVADTGVERGLAGSAYADRQAECGEALRVLRGRRGGVDTLIDTDPSELIAARHQLGEVPFRRARHIVLEHQRARLAAAAIAERDWGRLGRLMGESHRSLRNDYQVSSPELDALVEAAGECDGVYGARMTGAGFGGCTVTLTSPEAVDTVTGWMRRRLEERFGLEPRCFLAEPVGAAKPVPVREL